MGHKAANLRLKELVRIRQRLVHPIGYQGGGAPSARSSQEPKDPADRGRRPQIFSLSALRPVDFTEGTIHKSTGLAGVSHGRITTQTFFS